MSPWPDAPALRTFLRCASRRLVWIGMLEGAALGLGVACVITLAGWSGHGFNRAFLTGVALAAAGALARLALVRRRRHRVAHVIERRAPECRNIIVTAEELIGDPARVRPYIGALVAREAARMAGRLDVATLFPARLAAIVFATSAALWTIMVLGFAGETAATPLSAEVLIESADVRDIEATVTPPAYAARRPQTVRDPARIEALAGSRIELRVRAAAAAVTIETLSGRIALEPDGPRTFTGEVAVDADGFIAIEPATTDGRAGVRRLIGLTVTADREPRVRITSPGRDLFLADAPRAIAVTVQADDDLGLASLRLRYTKVSGSGEQFTFTDGDVPLARTRTDERAWTGRGSLRLDTLGLAAGDIVVYRAVATDRRPGAAPAESDAFIVEIAAPGSIAMEGFSMDDETDRYGLSQQMIILETERLIARVLSLSSHSLAQEARSLAAAQRSVRAEFVFMMGGELAEDVIDAAGMGDLNEEDHVEADDEAIAGRLATQGRVALIQAIRSMSRANAALNAVELVRALGHEKAALEHLQGAFSRTRYILRALTQRERIDLSRRLTGDLAEARRDVRVPSESGVAPQTAALRAALADFASLATAVDDRDAGARAAVLASTVLRIDPSSAPLQEVARWLVDASAAFGQGRAAEAAQLLDRAAIGLTAQARMALPASPHAPPPFDVRVLEGALTDALRRPGGPR